MKPSEVFFTTSIENERKNLSLRSWAGLKDAAKILRKTKISSVEEVEYTAHDRQIAFEETDRKAVHDEIYSAAVKAAPVHEINKVIL